MSGFEPPAPASRRQCSTKLSYTPDRRSRNGNSATREHVAGGCGGRKGVGGVLPATCGAGGAVVSTRRFGGFRRPCLCRASLLVTASLGASPSGKAAVFGTAIPRFESWRPSQLPEIYSEKALGRKIATPLGTKTHPTSGDSARVDFFPEAAPCQPGAQPQAPRRPPSPARRRRMSRRSRRRAPAPRAGRRRSAPGGDRAPGRRSRRGTAWSTACQPDLARDAGCGREGRPAEPVSPHRAVRRVPGAGDDGQPAMQGRPVGMFGNRHMGDPPLGRKRLLGRADRCPRPSDGARAAEASATCRADGVDLDQGRSRQPLRRARPAPALPSAAAPSRAPSSPQDAEGSGRSTRSASLPHRSAGRRRLRIPHRARGRPARRRAPRRIATRAIRSAHSRPEPR